MSRPAQRVLFASRWTLRTKLVNPAPRVALGRRTMSASSQASHASKSSDTPWMIGSALVFGPLLFLILSPRAAHHAPGHSSEHKSHHEPSAEQPEPEPSQETPPMTDDEGTVVPGEEIKESLEKAFVADAPKDAQAKEEAVAEAPSTEGTPSEETPSSTESEKSAKSEKSSEEGSSEATGTAESAKSEEVPSSSKEASPKPTDDKVGSAEQS